MKAKLTDRLIKTLPKPAAGNTVLWDAQIPGFGARITHAGAISFVLNYRAHGRERRFTIGRFPDFCATAARDEALRLRSQIKQTGLDPLTDKAKLRDLPALTDLAQKYLEEYAAVHKRASSAREDRRLLETAILPKLGRLSVDSIHRQDLEKLHTNLKGTPYIGNRVLALLSKLFSLANQWGLRDPSLPHPVKGIPRFPEDRRERWLKKNELDQLNIALAKQPNQAAADAIRLLILTGGRRGEVLSSRWEHFDLERAVWTKPSHATKEKKVQHVPLSKDALQLLAERKRRSDGAQLVFPGRTGNPIVDIKKTWKAACKAANLERVRLHDLRHSYASHLVSAGVSLHIVGQLLGHTKPQTTQRYAHVTDDALRAATERFAQIYKQKP